MASAAVEATGIPPKANGIHGAEKEGNAWMSPGPAAFDFRSRLFPLEVG